MRHNMSLQLPDLIKDLSTINIHDLCSEWDWLINGNRQVVAISNIGDLFLKDDEGKIIWMDASVGELKEAADSFEAFQLLMNDNECQENWFMSSLIEELQMDGIRIQDNQVYSFKVLPTLGGDYSSDNLEPTDIVVHFSFVGQIQKQIKDLPEGTPINSIKFKPGA
jgi:hypothetical protein